MFFLAVHIQRRKNRGLFLNEHGLQTATLIIRIPGSFSDFFKVRIFSADAHNIRDVSYPHVIGHEAPKTRARDFQSQGLWSGSINTGTVL